MQQRLSFITLGVDDIQKSYEFYAHGLGWQPAPSPLPQLVMFQLGGIALALCCWKMLTIETTLDAVVKPYNIGFRGMSLGYTVSSKETVHEVLLKAERAGATIIKTPQQAFWGGYHGYFADMDGHLWEVNWSPFDEVTEDGKFIIT